MFAFSEGFYEFLSGIGFAFGALAAGLWIMLGFYWWKNRTNATRFAFVWLAALIVASQSIRLYAQITTGFTSSEANFDALEWLRIFLNLSFSALAFFMFRHQIGAKDQDFKGSNG